MANHSEKDQAAENTHAVCFAEVLAKELVEVDALREDREIVDHRGSREAKLWEKVTGIAHPVRIQQTQASFPFTL